MMQTETQSTFWYDLSEEFAGTRHEMGATGRSAHFKLGSLMAQLRVILQRLDLKKTDYLLDIGCSNGLITTVLGGLCKYVYAVDLSPSQINLAEMQLIKYQGVNVISGNILDLCLLPESCDKINAFNLIQFLYTDENVSQALREMHRVLWPKGLAYIGAIPREIKDKALFVKSVESIKDDQIRNAMLEKFNNTMFFDPDKFKEAGEAVGFQVEILDMPAGFPDQNTRFDAILRKED